MKRVRILGERRPTRTALLGLAAGMMVLGALLVGGAGPGWSDADSIPCAEGIPAPSLPAPLDIFPAPEGPPTTAVAEVWSQVPGADADTAQIASVAPAETPGRCGTVESGTKVTLTNGATIVLAGAPREVHLTTVIDDSGNPVRVLVGAY